MRPVKLGLFVVVSTIGCGREVPATAGDRPPDTDQPVIAPAPHAPGATAAPGPGVVDWTLTRLTELSCQTEPRLGAAGDRVLFGCDAALYVLGDDPLEPLVHLPGADQNPHRNISDIAVGAQGDVWVAASEPAEGSNAQVHRVYRLMGRKLVSVGEPLASGGAARLFAWGDESLLAVAPDPPGQVRLATFGTRSPAPPLTAAGTPAHPFCEVASRGFDTALALAPGQVLLVTGQVCGVTSDASGETLVVNRGFGVEKLQRSEPQGTLELVDVERVARTAARGASSDHGPGNESNTAVDAPWLWAVDAAVAKDAGSVVIAIRGFGGPDGVAPPTWLLSTRDGKWAVQSPPTADGLARLWLDQAGATWGRDRDGQLWVEGGAGWVRVRPSLGARELVAELAFTRQGAWLLSRSASAPDVIRLYRGATGPVLDDLTVAAPPTGTTDQ